MPEDTIPESQQILELFDIEMGKRPLLQLLNAFKQGRIRTTRVTDTDNEYLPFKYQSDFLKSRKTKVFGIGANKSAKSEICFIKSALTLLGFNKDIPAPNEGWIVSVDWPQTRDVSIPRLFQFITPSDIQGWNKTEKILKLRNGSNVIFKSADSGRSKFQGATKDFIQIDEEIDEEVYKECLMRGKAGKRLYIWGSALPFNGLDTWLYKDIFLKQGDKYTDVFTPSIDDNLALLPEQVEQWKSQFSGAEYKIRILGQFINLAGAGIFDGEKLQEIRKRFCKPPDFVGQLIEDNQQVKPVRDENGHWQIWENPIEGESYSLGVDVATGDAAVGDSSCIQILKVSNQAQVAECHWKCEEDMMARQVVLGARYYKEAPVIIEVTGYGRAVQNIVMKDYYNLYRRETYDKFGQVLSEYYGWETKGGRDEGGTKPLLLTDGKRYVNACGCIRDLETVIEFGNYIWHKDKTTGARGGCYDDRVMAYLLALRQINEGKCDGNSPIMDYEEGYDKVHTEEDANEWLYV